MKKGLKSAIAIQLETGSNLPKTIAGRVQLVFELMNMEVVDKNGNPILKKDGTPKTQSFITKKQARKILDFK